MTLALPRLTDASVPYVQEGARSAHYELTKLVDGEIGGIFSVAGRPGFFVYTTYRFWHFDARGRLLGTSPETDVGPHGVGFDLIHPDTSTGIWRAWRRDWLLTGNDIPAEIPIEPVPKDDPAALMPLLRSADEIHEVSGYSPDHNGFHGIATRQGQDWKVLDLMAWDDSIRSNLPCTKKETKDRESAIWTAYVLDSLKDVPPSVLKQGHSLEWGGDSSAMAATNFSRRSIEFDEGFGAWVFWKTIGWWLLGGLPGRPPSAYWGGVGTFSLRHRGEELRFRATASSGEYGSRAFEVTADNLDLLELPGNLRLLRVVAPGKEHSLFYDKDGLTDKAHDEVGLYLVRERAPEAAVLKGSWLPEVEGLTWGTRRFPSGTVAFSEGPTRAFAQVPESESESKHDMPRGGRVLPQPFGQIPSNLRLRLPVRFGGYPASLAVHLGARDWLFLAHEDEPPVLQADIDRAEFAKAWEELEGGEMRLVAEFTERKEKVLDEGEDADRWVEPVLKLAKGRRSVNLAHTRWSAPDASWPRPDDERKRFLESRGYQAGRLARAGKLSAAGWIGATRDLLRDPKLAQEHGPWLVQQANDLLNAATVAKDVGTGRAVVEFWLEELSRTLETIADPEMVKARSVLTSNSLGNAIEWRDSALCLRIVEELVGENQGWIRHGTLHYNLACYYAWQKDVPAMLASIRRARANGKPASQFRADPDFAPWLQDPEFAKALGED